MTDIPENAAALVGCEFVHFKGGHYRLRGFAKDGETLETMVVYEALYGDGGLWVRPAKMFFENVTRDGKTFRRFALLEERDRESFARIWRCFQGGECNEHA